MDSIERIAKNAIIGIVSLWLLKNALEHIMFEISYIGFFGWKDKGDDNED